MSRDYSRRSFLSNVSTGTLVATLGTAVASDLGLMPSAFARDLETPLDFGDLEPLVRLLQETPLNKLQAEIVSRHRKGESSKRFIAAAALANARTFGGEDYIGFHTFMALAPAFKMSTLLSGPESTLPILKVLYRNTNRIHEFGGRSSEVLGFLAHGTDTPHNAADGTAEIALHEAVKNRKTAEAEKLLASMMDHDKTRGLEALLPLVLDNPEVHRVVLPYRAWDMQSIVGTEHALTLLRQSLHYCIHQEPSRRAEWDEHGSMLASVLDEFKLPGTPTGTKQIDDQHLDQLANAFSTATPIDAARAAAATLADGFDPKCVGEALSLAATMLVLRDAGRPPQWEDRLKPAGSTHGDSRGVHASDAANAWRNLASATRDKAATSCLIIGAWQLARDRGDGSYLLSESLPARHHISQYTSIAASSNATDQLLAKLDEAIQNKLQGHACAIAHCYGEQKLPADRIFATLMRYAISEDGALHAEKYFNTVWDDFHATRPSMRWKHICSLARVTASEFGTPAAGQQEARELLSHA